MEFNTILTPQQRFNIAIEITKKLKKCVNMDRSITENIDWEQVETDWLDFIEDTGTEHKD